MTVTKNDQHGAGTEPVDLSDPRLSRFEIVREGARRDDIEIVTYESQFPTPNSKAEKRIERTIALMFLLAGLLGLVFLAAYIFWPWEFELGHARSDYYTPILGISLGLALLAIGFAILTWAKKLLPHEVSIQDRHEGRSTDEDRQITGQTLLFTVDELGIQRRPLLKGAIALGLAPIGLVAAAPLVGGLIKNPHKPDRGQDPPMFRTGFDPVANQGRPVRLTHEDGTPIRPEDISVGGQITVFPGVPHGATNEYADSPTLLIQLRADDAAVARKASEEDERNKGAMWGNYVAFSKICTHAGCPASLYEQQTNRLLCPCHQSQFLITENARPIFGPASRRLPMLPITVDDEGYFVAASDYRETVGPDFWERP
ncbi:ubiquinol-cytochrome c reductase iron-sulfur subunit [Pseudosporangium ferrugineum]|uniref:Cytochrome bc1 complex Rieske iron-sulfur subunit n=1 Tax=Pseudosporangium ferrugineum TaxID=439699 RepID=A0A2T0SA32_9ACTN|nr:Rieske 2Fe-2S domain-containing protein [Pseudosporangium ferrugineum]PRY30173.1 menaquinol-cytochrome c reductase iron-sulfur subunit precursor [Pseudosporangium ferrugineum]